MSDYFGIGAAVKGAARVMFATMRGTGRTTALVESLKDGDRVVFTDAQQARRVLGLCKDRGIKIETTVVPVDDPGRIFMRGQSKGRTIFDHVWIEDFYLQAMDKTAESLAYLQERASAPKVTAPEVVFQPHVAERWEYVK